MMCPIYGTDKSKVILSDPLFFVLRKNHADFCLKFFSKCGIIFIVHRIDRRLKSIMKTEKKYDCKRNNRKRI